MDFRRFFVACGRYVASLEMAQVSILW